MVFFFSFNDIRNINPILKDRLTIVKFNGYTVDDKINISKDFIIPQLLENIGFNKTDITFSNNAIKYIILKYTNNEEGVRNIKRYIEDILLKINLLRLVKNPNNDNRIDIKYNIKDLKFPYYINDVNVVDNLLINNYK